MCIGKGAQFRALAVTNWLFSEQPHSHIIGSIRSVGYIQQSFDLQRLQTLKDYFHKNSFYGYFRRLLQLCVINMACGLFMLVRIILWTFCDVHRTSLNDEDYWLGLVIVPVTQQSATVWYDGNLSPYRNWAIAAEPNENNRCICYTNDGFRDQQCNRQYNYTCKKDAGNQYLLIKLLIKSSSSLFQKMQSPAHGLNSLLPPKKKTDYKLRNRHCSYTLPQCNFNVFKHSFVNWCLFTL